jgi:hypothetical protein
MMRQMVWALFLMPAVAGCANNVQMADTLFVQPGKYNFLRCQDIANRQAGFAARERELIGLMERANQSAAGPVINIMVYEADLEQARADQRLLARTAQEKNCSQPAPAAAAPAPPPASPAGPPAKRR